MITRRTTREDIECVLLARCGFSYRFIHRRTGLTTGQIRLRIKQTGSGIRKYRDGETPLAGRIAESVHVDVSEQMIRIKSEIQKQLLGKG